MSTPKTWPAPPSAALSANVRARNQLAAVFNALPGWKQAFLENIRAAVDKKVRANDLLGAYDIIQQMPTTMYAGMDADQAQFLALFTPPPATTTPAS